MTQLLYTRPFLKWAGGKYKLVPELTKYLPKDGKRYFEPFLGAGSLALNVP
jgi:DNA adenine methylase